VDWTRAGKIQKLPEPKDIQLAESTLMRKSKQYSNTMFLVSCDWIVVAGEMLCKDSVTSGLPQADIDSLLPPWDSRSIPATKDHTNKTLLNPSCVFINFLFFVGTIIRRPASTQLLATVGSFPENAN
jgi:hypothetical protein